MRKFIPVIILTLSSIAVFGQEVIRGVIKDDAGGPLPGATILVKGTNSGTVADVDGNFSVKPAGELPITLVVNSVGFKTQDVEVYELSDEVIEVALKSDNVLDEVVVIGYGEIKRRDITGSVASIPTELKAQPVASVERLLQGAIPGAIVTQTSGQPGGGVSVQIRGSNSITASSDPLYVIDGFPINNDYSIADAGITNGPKINPMSSINSADIESVDVLKDASATAIYGSRGANGVILITTKKGKEGESSIHYDGYYGVQEVIRTLPLATAGEWWQLRKDAAFNTSATAVANLKSANKAYLAAAESGGYTLDTAGVGTDWQGAAFKQAAIQSHSISIYSGTDRTKVAFGFNYFKQEGVIRETGFNRYAARFNIDHQFNDRFRLQSYVNASSMDAQVGPDAIVPNLLQSPASVPIYKNDGTFLVVSGLDQALANPINSLYNQTNDTNTKRLLANISVDYKLAEGLIAKVLFGTDVLINKQNRYLPNSTQEGLASKGIAQIGSLNTVNWLNENTLTWSKTFNNIHSLNVLGGFTAQRSTSDGVTAGATNFSSDFFEYNNLGVAVTPSSPGSSYTQWSLASWLGRVNYSLLEKYLLTLTIRSDGSSRFGSSNKWGYFPSAAVGWNIHEEEFLKQVNAISLLKLRGSVGITGNQSIPPYSSLSQLSYYRYNFNNQTVSGYAPSNVPNPGLGWEKTFQVDIGADIGLFNNRVDLVFDYYYKRTSDLLLSAIVPGTSGLAVGGNVNSGQQAAVYQNLGEVENKGWELGINTQNLAGEFKWNTIFVFSQNTNRILDLGNGITRIVPNTNAPSVIEVGKPLGSFIVYQTDGLIQPGEEGSSALTPQAFKGVGAQKYIDQDGDGVITQAGDRIVIANQPGVNLGLTNTFSYKGFDLSVFFQGSFGGKLYNQNRAQLELNNGAGNASDAAKYAYRVPGTRGPDDPGFTDTDVKAAYQDPAITVSDRFIEDASYVRLKNVSFGYRIPESVLSKAFIKSLRIYVSAQNYWTWTDYTGYDPEASNAGQALINRGVDNGVYPNNKSIQGGVQLTF
ncbi:TonB-dependent receptor [Chryseolinea sp. T2]|uniref:SusC/RagA family TonB-linked outer membrane protein n=1 Tax=Chryseolinea sp. T2 TaxID=3129255 RepID=UPI0030775058